MALSNHKTGEGTSTAGLWQSFEDKTKTSKQKCIFKNHLMDNNCTKTECLLYPKLSCRKFTYTTNADKYVPRCEHLLNQTRCFPLSDLRCNPFQIPLKDIVAQEIRLCAEDSCSNYSLRYIFKNSCKCDMNTLRGLLPSYRGYDNICCKRRNYNGKLADKIDAAKLQMFQKKLATAVEKTKRSYASDPYGIHGSIRVQTRCKSLAPYQVQLSKVAGPSAETNYLFRNQLMEMAKRKFEENKDLALTETTVNAEVVRNTELRVELDNSNIWKPTDKVPEVEEQLKANEVLHKNEETVSRSDSIPVDFDINRTDDTNSYTLHGEGLTMSNKETGLLLDNGGVDLHIHVLDDLEVMADELKAVSGEESELTMSNKETGLLLDNGGVDLHIQVLDDLEVMADELKAVSGEESEFTSNGYNLAGDDGLDFTVDVKGFGTITHSTVEGAEVDESEVLSDGVLLGLNTVSEEVNSETRKTVAEESENGSEIQE